MFKEFSPMQWQAIEVANNYGLDKLTYEDRISWVKQNLNALEAMDNPDEPELYNRAVRGLRLAQQGIPTGHTVALDAVCSGLQVMSVLMGCESGCSITGLVHQDVRSDAYTAITDSMNTMAPVSVPRKDAKDAVMTALYGSIKVPKDIFGEELLEVFYTALRNEAPGAVQLLELLRGAWNTEADYHTWELPDGHMAVVPVTEMVEKRVHVAELKYTPVILVEEVKPQEKGISLIANVVHSVDAYVLRTLVRRCLYSPRVLKASKAILESSSTTVDYQDTEANRVWKHTGMADFSMLEGLTLEEANKMSLGLKRELLRMIELSLSHKPFEIVCIHDSFGCHANNVNQMRRVYADIMASLCRSTLAEDLLNQLYGNDAPLQKLSNTAQLAEKIAQSNYGVC